MYVHMYAHIHLYDYRYPTVWNLICPAGFTLSLLLTINNVDFMALRKGNVWKAPVASNLLEVGELFGLCYPTHVLGYVFFFLLKLYMYLERKWVILCVKKGCMN